MQAVQYNVCVHIHEPPAAPYESGAKQDQHPDGTTHAAISQVCPIRAKVAACVSQVAVVVVSVITVVLWCLSTAWASVVGNQGIVALLPLVIFFGFGILDKDDFNSFLWHVVMLAQVRLRRCDCASGRASA